MSNKKIVKAYEGHADIVQDVIAHARQDWDLDTKRKLGPFAEGFVTFHLTLDEVRTMAVDGLVRSISDQLDAERPSQP